MTESVGVVTYLDFGLSFAETAPEGLRAWAARVRAQSGADEAMLLNEVNRSERFALVETWSERESLNAHHASGARQEPSSAPGLAAPPDERIGEPFSLGTARPAGPQALYVLIHVDVATFELTAVGEWLKAQAEAACSTGGALRYEVWRQTGRPNHFTVIQAWADLDAYARHIEAAATRAFRENLMTFKGALYDERLYRRLD
jgi:quinol monooxygenase YgiN